MGKAFEKWWKTAACMHVSYRGITEDAFNAALTEAARICREVGTRYAAGSTVTTAECARAIEAERDRNDHSRAG